MDYTSENLKGFVGLKSPNGKPPNDIKPQNWVYAELLADPEGNTNVEIIDFNIPTTTGITSKKDKKGMSFKLFIKILIIILTIFGILFAGALIYIFKFK